jgi:hypothetical protein
MNGAGGRSPDGAQRNPGNCGRWDSLEFANESGTRTAPRIGYPGFRYRFIRLHVSRSTHLSLAIFFDLWPRESPPVSPLAVDLWETLALLAPLPAQTHSAWLLAFTAAAST